MLVGDARCGAALPSVGWGTRASVTSRGAAPARGVFLLFLSLPSPLLSAQGKLLALQTAAPHALLAQGALPPALRLLR